MPVLIDATSDRDEAALVAERIATACAAGREFRDIAILLRTRYLMPPFERALAQRGLPFLSMASGRIAREAWTGQTIKLLTLHSSKGLEFPLVFISGLQAMPHRGESIDEEVRLLYVGMTRATHELVFSARGNSTMVEKVRESIDVVRTRFGTAR